jgi:hypothetical protein
MTWLAGVVYMLVDRPEEAPCSFFQVAEANGEYRLALGPPVDPR